MNFQHGDERGAMQQCTVTGHSSVVSSVHFSPDGARLVIGRWDKTVMVWRGSEKERERARKSESESEREREREREGERERKRVRPLSVR